MDSFTFTQNLLVPNGKQSFLFEIPKPLPCFVWPAKGCQLEHFPCFKYSQFNITILCWKFMLSHRCSKNFSNLYCPIISGTPYILVELFDIVNQILDALNSFYTHFFLFRFENFSWTFSSKTFLCHHCLMHSLFPIFSRRIRA